MAETFTPYCGQFARVPAESITLFIYKGYEVGFQFGAYQEKESYWPGQKRHAGHDLQAARREAGLWAYSTLRVSSLELKWEMLPRGWAESNPHLD